MFTNCLALWTSKELELQGFIQTTTNKLMKSKLSHMKIFCALVHL